jgi:hypothetical protein
VIAIVALEEIIDEGNFISISEAQKKNLIPENLKPVLEIRAFGTHVRLVDTFAGRSSRGKDGLFIEDARWLIAQELGKDIQHFDKLAYFKWLATTIGKNLGLMHKNKWIHKYLGMGHNITLDGCFVDFDSVEYLESPQRDAFEYDYNETRNALSKLLIFLGQTFSDSAQKDIINNFKTAYRENKY